MPNVLNVEPMRALVRRAGKKVPEGAVRDRFERLAFAELLRERRNFRPAQQYDVKSGPDWVHDAATRGDDLVVFELDRSTAARMHNVARRLGATCSLAALNDTSQPHLRHAIGEARRLVGKIHHTSFDVLVEKGRRLARAHLNVAVQADFDKLCEERAVAATCKRTWRRITCVAALQATGREFQNCLARRPHTQFHAERLRAGSHQYWVLRAFDGAGLVVLMTDAPRATHFIEVRGPRNTGARGHDADLRILAAALGMNVDPPPPPPSILALSMEFEEMRRRLLRAAA